MDDFLKEALEIVKVQASVRVMSEEEITTMIHRLSKDIRSISEDGTVSESATQQNIADARKSIREKTVTCLECGKSFKVLTKRHLLSHGLTADEYREKWGLKKDTPLVCKGLQRDRRKKMKDMKLWEKRKKVV